MYLDPREAVDVEEVSRLVRFGPVSGNGQKRTLRVPGTPVQVLLQEQLEVVRVGFDGVEPAGFQSVVGLRLQSHFRVPLVNHSIHIVGPRRRRSAGLDTDLYFFECPALGEPVGTSAGVDVEFVSWMGIAKLVVGCVAE